MGRLSQVIQVSESACQLLAEMVKSFYTVMNSETSKLKADASVFTIADGIVQHLLVNHLFGGDKFGAIVGEEDSKVNIHKLPFTVDDLTVPDEFCDLIDSVRKGIDNLSHSIQGDLYKDISVFIDPIDGTREFATGLGEQCTICIGFANVTGVPVAGIVFRPIPTRPTWAAGVASEGYVAGELDIPSTPNPTGFLTSNGSISKFIVSLMDKLKFTRVPSGGAGNKMLMLLEGKGGCYIQDRGVSRWDTCAAQAVIEAYGGRLCKLNDFVTDKSLHSYTYKKSDSNLDFVPNQANLTAYNCADSLVATVKGSKTPLPVAEVTQIKPYANVCGLFALDKLCLSQVDQFHNAIQEAKKENPLSYD